MAQEDVIFLQTDPLFGLVVPALNGHEYRLDTRSASINTIHNSAGNNVFTPHWFGRTAAAIYRMTMLDACRIRPQLWPRGPTSRAINLAQMTHDVDNPAPNPIPLADDNDTARRMYSHYDALFPHYGVEVCVPDVGAGVYAATKMMVVFHNNFQQLTQIATSIRIERRGLGQIDGFVHVVYNRYQTKMTDSLEKLKKIFGEASENLLPQGVAAEEEGEEEGEGEEGVDKKMTKKNEEEEEGEGEEGVDKKMTKKNEEEEGEGVEGVDKKMTKKNEEDKNQTCKTE